VAGKQAAGKLVASKNIAGDAKMQHATCNMHNINHVVVLGLARQGLALVEFFMQQGTHVTVSDAAGPGRSPRISIR